MVVTLGTEDFIAQDENFSALWLAREHLVNMWTGSPSHPAWDTQMPDNNPLSSIVSDLLAGFAGLEEVTRTIYDVKPMEPADRPRKDWFGNPIP